MERENYKGKAPKILIVDDINANVKILEKIVSMQGYESLCALSVQEALDIMQETMPQLILSDISMPGMDGMEFCKLLKSNSKTRDIPLIFITVADSSEEKQAAFEAGAADFIPKPFDRVEVTMRIQNQLQSYQLKQEMENYNRMMHKMVVDQKKMMEKERKNVLLALAELIKKKDERMGGHMERVAYNCYLLAQCLQLTPEYEDIISDEFVDTIDTAVKLYNIGYLVMPDWMREEEGDEDDRGERIRVHTEEGARILESISKYSKDSRYLKMAIQIARYHHANWDGSGYPEGMAGTEIPLAARITAVVNDFDSMITACKGRTDLLEQCKEDIGQGSATLYDPGIVGVFEKVIRQFKID